MNEKTLALADFKRHNLIYNHSYLMYYVFCIMYYPSAKRCLESGLLSVYPGPGCGLSELEWAEDQVVTRTHTHTHTHTLAYFNTHTHTHTHTH